MQKKLYYTTPETELIEVGTTNMILSTSGNAGVEDAVKVDGSWDD